MADAGISPTTISYISAHGTATQLNDRSETSAIKTALGDHAYNVPISSTKSMTGHIMGGTGAIESIFCTLAIRDRILPATINYQTPDPECDLDYVPNTPRPARRQRLPEQRLRLWRTQCRPRHQKIHTLTRPTYHCVASCRPISHSNMPRGPGQFLQGQPPI